jgi:hypothetical protein
MGAALSGGSGITCTSSSTSCAPTPGSCRARSRQMRSRRWRSSSRSSTRVVAGVVSGPPDAHQAADGRQAFADRGGGVGRRGRARGRGAQLAAVVPAPVAEPSVLSERKSRLRRGTRDSRGHARQISPDPRRPGRASGARGAGREGLAAALSGVRVLLTSTRCRTCGRQGRKCRRHSCAATRPRRPTCLIQNMNNLRSISKWPAGRRVITKSELKVLSHIVSSGWQRPGQRGLAVAQELPLGSVGSRTGAICQLGHLAGAGTGSGACAGDRDGV